MNTQVKDVGLVIFGIILFAAVFMSLQRVDRFLKIKAIDDCGKISRYEYVNPDGSRTTSPVDEIYKACLKQKGF